MTKVIRLTTADRDRARELFRMLSEVFENEHEERDDASIDRLLAREDFWALAAVDADRVVGGLTAHTLPMTRGQYSELFIYDIAVRPTHQRRGIGRQLIADLRQRAAAAGMANVFVAADDEDAHALDFYRALGGEPAPVTMFTFEDD